LVGGVAGSQGCLIPSGRHESYSAGGGANGPRFIGRARRRSVQVGWWRSSAAGDQAL